MKLEQQLVSLELSKRLKELGVKQDGYFSWLHCDPRSGGSWYVWQTDYDHMIELPEFPAYTVAELGEMLPHDFMATFFRTLSEGWGFDISEDDFVAYADTEADIRAKMLIYLIENGLLPITPKGK